MELAAFAIPLMTPPIPWFKIPKNPGASVVVVVVVVASVVVVVVVVGVVVDSVVVVVGSVVVVTVRVSAKPLPFSSYSAMPAVNIIK